MVNLVTSDQFLTVEADLGFEDRISSGNYRYCSSDIFEQRFPITDDQTGNWEWKLFRFRNTISSRKVIRLMRQDVFDPAAIGHMLAFKERYPKEQLKYTIVGLGSVARIDWRRRVPEARNDGRVRELTLGYFGCSWDPYYQFLGVRRRPLD